MTDANSGTIKAWNTVLFDKFMRFQHVITKGLSVHSDELFGREPFSRGARVLDVGSGFGDTTLQIAELVGEAGSATGVDCADNFTQAAEKNARDAKVGNAAFRTVDVQSGDLGGPYDQAFSRFGTMFFDLPGAALRNIRRSLRDGGKLTMIVWRKREDNPWVFEAERRVKEIVPVVSHEETDQVHCGPGPFSMSGPDLVSDLLRSAGYRRIGFERFDAEICIGRSLDEAVAFAMNLGPAGEVIRLAGEEGVKRTDQVLAALTDVLGGFARKDGSVWAASSTWFVTAQNTSG